MSIAGVVANFFFTTNSAGVATFNAPNKKGEKLSPFKLPPMIHRRLSKYGLNFFYRMLACGECKAKQP